MTPKVGSNVTLGGDGKIRVGAIEEKWADDNRWPKGGDRCRNKIVGQVLFVKYSFDFVADSGVRLW